MNNLETYLTNFRERYPITKVLQDQDKLTYIFRTFYNASKAATEANMLIEQMDIPLVAIHHGTSSYFVVKSSEVEL